MTPAQMSEVWVAAFGMFPNLSQQEYRKLHCTVSWFVLISGVAYQIKSERRRQETATFVAIAAHHFDTATSKENQTAE